jgi:CheY-like chemotaxis protein
MSSESRPPSSTGDGADGSETQAILIVDDEPILLELIRDILEEEGFSVLTASSATAALYVAQRSPISLVLTDLMMPNLSGLELADRLRSHPETAEIPIILMSAAPPASHPPLFVAVIRKPFPIETLVGVVRRYAEP